MDKSLKSASNKARINETSRRCRRILDDKIKTTVVLDTLREEKTLNEIAAKCDIHPNQISLWKNEFIKNAGPVFTAPR